MVGFIVIITIFLIFSVYSITVIEYLLMLRNKVEEGERIYKRDSKRRVEYLRQKCLIESENERIIVENITTQSDITKLKIENDELNKMIRSRDEANSQYERELEGSYSSYVSYAKRYNKYIAIKFFSPYAKLMKLKRLDFDEV